MTQVHQGRSEAGPRAAAEPVDGSACHTCRRPFAHAFCQHLRVVRSVVRGGAPVVSPMGR